MNMHVPQSIEASNELQHIVAVPYQLVSPSQSKPIVGIVQDTLTGAYIISDLERMQLTNQQWMNNSTCNKNNYIFDTRFDESIGLSGKEYLSDSLPPNLNITSNKLKIKNGKFLEGLLTKTTIKKDSLGLVHAAYNDYGPNVTKTMIDNLRGLITSYLLTHGFSVGVSDIIINSDFEKNLFITFQSYIDYNAYYPKKNILNSDHRGNFSEIIRSESKGQSSFSVQKLPIQPGFSEDFATICY